MIARDENIKIGNILMVYMYIFAVLYNHDPQNPWFLFNELKPARLSYF